MALSDLTIETAAAAFLSCPSKTLQGQHGNPLRYSGIEHPLTAMTEAGWLPTSRHLYILASIMLARTQFCPRGWAEERASTTRGTRAHRCAGCT